MNEPRKVTWILLAALLALLAGAGAVAVVVSLAADVLGG
jgi:hypothetical protein